MADSFRVARNSLVCLWDEMLGLVGANLIWFAVSLPLFALLWLILPKAWAILLVFLLVVAPNPLVSGVHLVARQALHGESTTLSLAWQGIKRNFRKSLIVFAIDCALLALIIANAGFYLSNANSLMRFVGLLWVAILVFWLGIQVYLQPFLLTRPEKGSLNLFRDSLYLVVANPVFTITVLVFVLVTILVSVVFGLAVPLLMMVLVALLQNQAMAVIEEKYTGRKAKRNGAI